MNTIGHNLKLTVYGESHGKSIGAVLDGLPSGEYLDWDEVKKKWPEGLREKHSVYIT